MTLTSGQPRYEQKKEKEFASTRPSGMFHLCSDPFDATVKVVEQAWLIGKSSFSRNVDMWDHRRRISMCYRHSQGNKLQIAQILPHLQPSALEIVPFATSFDLYIGGIKMALLQCTTSHIRKCLHEEHFTLAKQWQLVKGLSAFTYGMQRGIGMNTRQQQVKM